MIFGSGTPQNPPFFENSGIYNFTGQLFSKMMKEIKNLIWTIFWYLPVPPIPHVSVRKRLRQPRLLRVLFLRCQARQLLRGTRSAFSSGFAYLERFATLLLHPGQTPGWTTWRSTPTGTLNGCGLTKTKSWKKFHQKILKTFWEKSKKLFRKKTCFSRFFFEKVEISKISTKNRKFRIFDFFRPDFWKTQKMNFWFFFSTKHFLSKKKFDRLFFSE